MSFPSCFFFSFFFLREKFRIIFSFALIAHSKKFFLFRTRWLKSSDEFLRTSSASIDGSPSRSSILEKLRQFKYEEEMAFIHRLVTKIQSPVVFAHNDMQEGNILLRTSPGKIADRISLIDFEYCSYNYRGYDLANHFCEWMYCYKVSEEPFFTSNKADFPNSEQQVSL